MRVSMCMLQGMVLAGALVLVQVAAQGQTSESPSGVYTCTDAKGRKLTSDRPIAECVDREQKVLNPSGTVRARVGPTLTAKERAAAEAKEREESEARALLVEEKRRERALLIRYPSREVHDKERSEAITQVAAVVQAASKRIEELQQDRRQLEVEMEFYKKAPSKAPPSIRRQIEDLAHSMSVQQRFISDQENETRRINARFDDELMRLKQLWAAQARSKPADSNAKKTP